MSLESLLDHTCDIYHIIQGAGSPGYGLPASPVFEYPEEPDAAAVSCHFGVRSQSVSITQTAPVNVMEARIKLTLPIGTDIRRQDKIVDCDSGLEYTAEQPRNVRNHHMYVYIKMKDGQGAL